VWKNGGIGRRTKDKIEIRVTEMDCVSMPFTEAVVHSKVQ
jgi:hypothetical protein